MKISRREVLKAGVAAAALGSVGGISYIFRQEQAHAALVGGIAGLAVGGVGTVPYCFSDHGALERTPSVSLTIEEVLVEMVDLTPVYMWTFGCPQYGPRLPGPVIIAGEGSTVEISVTNNLDEDHAFAVPGVANSGAIPPGETHVLNFVAPAAGTYIYLDPLNAPVNRVMGLHGVMVVMPPAGMNTPYGSPTDAVQRLFDDLGTTPLFPGDPWDPSRTWIWVFHTIDPSKNRLVMELRDEHTISPEVFTDGYLPRYFTISGKTGFFASHDEKILPHGNIGQPGLIRVVNTGLATHSPHIHGNHVYELSDNGRVFNNLPLVDTFAMEPMHRKDVLLPFVQPPDAVPWPPSNLREFPMPFPMHCHMEPSQTAAGGNYPQGLVTDWEITSPYVGGPEDHEEFPLFRGMDPALFE